MPIRLSELRGNDARWLLLALVAACVLALNGPSFADEFDDAASHLYQTVRAAAAQRGALITSGGDYERVQSITRRLIAVAPEMRPDAAAWGWDVLYIRSPKVNAMCLPGGQMIVLSSLIERLALTDDEIAAVMGHEMAHALLDHQREQYMQRQTARAAVGLLGIIAAIASAKHHTDPNLAFNATTAVGSIGAEFLALRPYNRERELAADKYGAELAARAGFDPRGAISLQQKLFTAGTVEFLSTHPVSETRVAKLSEVVPELTQRFAARREPQTMTARAVVTDSVAPVSIQAAPVRPPNPVAMTTQQTAAMETSRQPDANALVQPGQATTPTARDPDAITGAAAAAMTSKYMFSAECYAKDHGCAPPSATMIVRAPSYESFDIGCGGGSHLLVRCEYGNCAVAAE